MCFHSGLEASQASVKQRFKSIKEVHGEFHNGYFNGFAHPFTPIICNDEPEVLQMASWGLLPSWSKDKEFRKNTLNARIETIKEKPSFKASVDKRCLILADHFFEWQWQDAKGKDKTKFNLSLPDKEIYGYAGLYNDWTDKGTGETFRTYCILTMDANELMAEIHNTKKRMPVIPSVEHEFSWLEGGDLIIQNDRLIAEAV